MSKINSVQLNLYVNSIPDAVSDIMETIMRNVYVDGPKNVLFRVTSANLVPKYQQKEVENYILDRLSKITVAMNYNLQWDTSLSDGSPECIITVA